MFISPPLRQLLLAASAVSLFAATASAQSEKTSFKFFFGSGAPKAGFTRVAPTAVYGPETGFGFEKGDAPRATATGCSSEKPFLFSVKVPEGNYTVTATLGGAQEASVTTIKAEARRLMIGKVETTPGKTETRTFTVNVRTPAIAGGGEVKINKREQGPPMVAHWDEKLTLEFNNTHPSISSLEITKTDRALTVYLAGDSTVTDQPHEPWAGWGQMLPSFFKADVAVANQAESGLALNSFASQKRLDKISSTIKKGDYVFIQFGHNDQKQKGEGAGAFTTYKANLKQFIDETRKHEANPVLVTPMNRRRFDASGQQPPTLGDYPDAVRQTAQEEKVPLIDLNAMSTILYGALGPEESKKLFVHYPAGTFPRQDKELKDDTHHNAYGGMELAKCIVEGIKAHVPELAKHLMDGLPTFDPSHPDAIDKVAIPASPFAEIEKPAGS